MLDKAVRDLGSSWNKIALYRDVACALYALLCIKAIQVALY